MTDASDARSEGRGWALCLGASVAMTALIFNRVVFAGEWLARRDTLRVYLPLAKYWTDRVKAGEFPEWYPFSALGQPFVGMVISAPFHPARVLNLLLSPEYAHCVQTLLCYPVAALFTYGCARRLKLGTLPSLFAAITFLGSGYLVGISNNLAYLIAAATIPAALWTADRFFAQPTTGRLAIASGVLALVLLGGDVQSFVLTGGVVMVLALLRPAERRKVQQVALAASVVLCAIILALPVLLPAWDTLREARGSVNPLRIAESFSLHPTRLLELAFGPLFIEKDSGVIPSVYETTGFIDTLSHSAWVDSIAVGVIGLGFACAGLCAVVGTRFGKVALGGTLLSLLLVLGSHSPVYGWFFRFVPLWNAFRYPEKLAVWLTWLVALGAGFGLSRALQDAAFARRVAIALGAVSLAVALTTLLMSEALLVAMAVPKERAAEVLGRLHAQGGVSLASALIAVAMLVRRVWVPRADDVVTGTGLICLHAVVLAVFALPLPQTIKLDLLKEPVGLVSEALAAGAGTLGGPRVDTFARDHLLPSVANYTRAEIDAMGIVGILAPDSQALFGIETSGYYHPAGSSRMARGFVQPHHWQRSLAALYGAAYFTSNVPDMQRYGELPGNRVVAVLEEWGVVFWRMEHALPRVYLAQPRCVASVEAAFTEITKPSFVRGLEAIIECDRADATALPPTDRLGTAVVDHYAPEEVNVTVSARAPAVLVLNDAYYSGWSVTVDGQPSTILPTNVAVRGVRVPAGDHRLSFRYRQPGLRVGLACAGSLLALYCVSAFFGVMRRRRMNATV